MPVKIAKTDDRYKVSTPSGTKAKGTTLKKAKAQQRLLNAIEHNPNFKPRGMNRAELKRRLKNKKQKKYGKN